MLDVDDDLDDTHLCIKCSETIHGLANYIQHRKTSCSGKHISNPIQEIQQVQHSYTTYDFPSANVNVVVSKNQLENFPFSYDLEHHHHHHDHDGHVEHDDAVNVNVDAGHATNTNSTLEVVNKKSVSSVTKDITAENYNFNYGLGADVFFSSLELQSSTRKGSVDPSTASGGKVGLHNRILTRKATAAILAHQGDTDPHVVDWIGGNTQSESEDKLMKAVNDISGATSSGNTSSKKVETMFGLIEFHPDSPISSSDDDDEEEDFDAPPRGHTGGKWKPEHRPIDNYPAWDVRHHHWDVTDDTAIINNSSKLYKSSQNAEELDDEFSPPPEYTKGKWVPGSKITKLEYKTDCEVKKTFNDQYWCSICNRKLSSRIVYERHLRSNLHLKRAQPENELEEASRSFVDSSLFSRRVTKPSIYLNQDIYATSLQLKRTSYSSTMISEEYEEHLKELSVSSENQVVKNEPDASLKKKRKRNRLFIRCDVCRTRLRMHLFGKHLISHYHYRRMINNPKQSFAVILENMHRIVRESPFQCQPCRFYANTEEQFNRHWNSKEHLEVVTPLPGRYWCILCQFDCEDNNEMFKHISGEEHSEVIWVINRSVPIIIRKRTILRCKDCRKEFRYNIELRKHSTKCRPSGTGSNQYQSKFICTLCPTIVFQSRTAVQKHQGKIHKQKVYFCRPCDLKFKSPKDARFHRNSTEHKIAVFKLRNGNDSLKLAKKCSICSETLPDIIQLKGHIAKMHPESKHSCSMCGKKFILAQEVSRHVRDKACKFDATENLVNIHDGNILQNKPYECDLPVAPFTTAVAVNTSDEISTVVSTDTTTITPITNATSIAIRTNNTTFTLPVNNFIDTRAITTKCSNSSEMFFSIAPVVTQSCYTPKTVTSLIKTDATTPDAAAAVLNTENCKITAGTTKATKAANKLNNVKSVIGVDDGQTEVEVLITGVDNIVNTTNQDATTATNNNNNKNSTWKCKFCPFKTSSQAECIFHEILHNVQNANNLATLSSVSPLKLLDCTICDKKFRKSSLRIHLRQHTNERIFKCRKCLMSFTRQQNLKSHIAHIHKNVEVPSDGTNANATTDADTGANVKTNKKTNRKKCEQPHSSEIPEENNYVCQLCNRKFNKKCILKQHMYVHRNYIENHEITPLEVEEIFVDAVITPMEKDLNLPLIKIKEFKCVQENCIFSCRSASELKTHLLIHSTIKNYQCDHHRCNYKTKTIKQLKRHKKIHLEILDDDNDGLKHVCTQCNFRTRLTAHLKRHMRIHTGEKPYKCPHCDYASNNCENLRKHVITTTKHKGKFLYTCNICEEKNETEFNTNFYKQYQLHLYKTHNIKQ